MAVNQDIDETQTAESTMTPEGMTPLSVNFSPGSLDVICGRGKATRDHEGNVAFRSYIETEIDRYSQATSKLEKTIIVSQIVQFIRSKSPKGGFVKFENGYWYEVGDHQAREKVGQSLRDLLHSKYKSSTKAKKIRRKEITVKMNDDVDELIMTNSNVSSRMKRLTEDISRGASDDYIGDLFNQTNVAILNEIKKDKRLLIAAHRTSSGTATDDSKSNNSIGPETSPPAKATRWSFDSLLVNPQSPVASYPVKRYSDGGSPQVKRRRSEGAGEIRRSAEGGEVQNSRT